MNTFLSGVLFTALFLGTALVIRAIFVDAVNTIIRKRFGWFYDKDSFSAWDERTIQAKYAIRELKERVESLEKAKA